MDTPSSSSYQSGPVSQELWLVSSATRQLRAFLWIARGLSILGCAAMIGSAFWIWQLVDSRHVRFNLERFVREPAARYLIFLSAGCLVVSALAWWLASRDLQAFLKHTPDPFQWFPRLSAIGGSFIAASGLGSGIGIMGTMAALLSDALPFAFLAQAVAVCLLLFEFPGLGIESKVQARVPSETE